MDEEEGLQLLVAQRSQRPSFTRMISWEFCDDVHHVDRTKVVSMQRHQRRRSKQQSGETTQHREEDDFETHGHNDLDHAMRLDTSFEDTSDSDEDFFSAEEFVISDSEPDTKKNVSFSSGNREDMTCGRDAGEGCENDEDTVYTEQNTNLNSSFSNVKPSRLSKKQKKKRRKEVCIMYENELRPLTDREFDDIRLSDQANDDKTLNISKDVPSLVQLCIRSAYNIDIKSELPNTLQCLIRLDDDFSLQRLQLSWLHSTLSQFEPQENFDKNFMSVNEPWKLLYPARNVWNHTPEDCNGSEVSATLPCTIFQIARDVGLQKAILTWAVVAATVELMIPPFLSADAYRNQSESEDDRIVRATSCVMARLKYAMKNRFPTVVSHCFDHVVPYALWARGDIHQATKYFLSLSQNTTKDSLKGLYLNEVGRMHAQVGAIETAAKFYRLASDAVLMDGRSTLQADEVTTQMLMLVANLYDQGVLTPQKGKQSIQAWNAVKKNKYSHTVDGLERHIMDSYFCIHSGSVQRREWLEQAKPMLIDLLTFDPQLLYYLSMVHALLGNEKEAHTVYWDYVKGMKEDFMNSAGRDMVTLSGQGSKCNPWIPLVTMVREMDNNIHFLPVLWRMQLQHLKVSAGSGTESDICSKTLDLHFDSSGCLTGNMQMFLPPVRRIKLNPYTSALQFCQHNSLSKALTRWDSCGEIPYIVAGVFVIPTLLEVYNKDGIKVHFMLGKKAWGTRCDNSLDMATLIWTGPDGRKARLNIFKLLREHCIREAKKKTSYSKKNLCKAMAERRDDAKKFIDLCLAKRRVICPEWILHQVCEFSMHRSDFRRKMQRKEREWAQKFEPREGEALPEVKYTYVKPETLDLEYYAHSETYRIHLTYITVLDNVLTFFTQQPSTYSNYLWTVGLESKDAFLASKKPLMYHPFKKLRVRNQIGHTIAGTNLLLSRTLDSNEFKVKNIEEKQEDTEMFVKSSPPNGCADITQMFVFGSQIFGLSFNNRIWTWSKKNSQREIEGEEFAGVYDLDLVGNVLVVNTSRGVRFTPVPADCDQSLYSLPVVLSQSFKGTPLTLNEDGTMICRDKGRIKVTGTQEEMRDGKKVYRAAICLDNITVVMLVPSELNGPKGPNTIEIIMAVTLPGYGMETCFISQQVGVLFGWTHSQEATKDYREHIFQVDYNAKLRGVLPFLGPGPRSFLPVYLPGDSDIQAKHPGHGHDGWYVFMRDGHDGIIGVKLFC